MMIMMMMMLFAGIPFLFGLVSKKLAFTWPFWPLQHTSTRQVHHEGHEAFHNGTVGVGDGPCTLWYCINRMQAASTLDKNNSSGRACRERPRAGRVLKSQPYWRDK